MIIIIFEEDKIFFFFMGVLQYSGKFFICLGKLLNYFNEGGYNTFYDPVKIITSPKNVKTCINFVDSLSNSWVEATKS